MKKWIKSKIGHKLEKSTKKKMKNRQNFYLFLILTFQFIAFVTTIFSAIAFPPVGNTLAVIAAESPFVALRGVGEKRCRENRTFCFFTRSAIGFVGSTGTIFVAITSPRLENTLTVTAIELPVFAFMFGTILFVFLSGTVKISVTFPGFRKTLGTKK